MQELSLFYSSMQGVQRFEYKALREQLEKMRKIASTEGIGNHMESINEHETKLIEIYNEYLNTMNNIAAVVKKFEQHKMAIRRLTIVHKQLLKG